MENSFKTPLSVHHRSSYNVLQRLLFGNNGFLKAIIGHIILTCAQFCLAQGKQTPVFCMKLGHNRRLQNIFDVWGNLFKPLTVVKMSNINNKNQPVSKFRYYSISFVYEFAQFFQFFLFIHFINFFIKGTQALLYDLNAVVVSIIADFHLSVNYKDMGKYFFILVFFFLISRVLSCYVFVFFFFFFLFCFFCLKGVNNILRDS